MKKIIIIHSDMEIGGVETSLIGLLNSIDYSKYSVDLVLFNYKGDLLKLIPSEVNLILKNKFEDLTLPIKKVIKKGNYRIAYSRIKGKTIGIYYNKIKKCRNICYITKQYSHKYSQKFIPNIPGEYDIAISFIDPHYILNKVNSKLKLGWIHTDFRRIQYKNKLDYDMWNICDYIVSVSDACKDAFDERYPNLKSKSIVIENVLSKNFVINQSEKKINNKNFNQSKKNIKLLSIGRFSEAKNFDNVPKICSYILEYGIKVVWYIIGYGADEVLIRQKIKEYNMENNVILLGKQENPYPYIKACDIYVQPSRYEGKAVAVREAQILNKPVVITNFETSKSQLTDGFDGIIVPMDNEGCAEGICNLINDKELQERLIENTKVTDYTNKKELEKIYALLED